MERLQEYGPTSGTMTTRLAALAALCASQPSSILCVTARSLARNSFCHNTTKNDALQHQSLQFTHPVHTLPAPTRKHKNQRRTILAQNLKIP